MHTFNLFSRSNVDRSLDVSGGGVVQADDGEVAALEEVHCDARHICGHGQPQDGQVELQRRQWHTLDCIPSYDPLVF